MHFMNNNYQFQPNFAFLPFYTLLVKLIKILCYNNLNATICILTIVNRCLLYYTARQLYLIAKYYSNNQKIALKTILLFIYNPALIFYVSVYSESVYAFMMFKYIRISLQSQQKGLVKCVLILCVAITLRSTAMFMLPVIGYPIICDFIKSIKNVEIPNIIRHGVKGVIIIIVVLLPFILYLIWSYQQICHNQTNLQQCTTNNYFNVYSYVQTKYWNVGLFNYYTKQNIMFIIIGLPAILFSLITLKIHSYSNSTTMGIDISWILLICITVSMTNIQSGTRFFSSHPIFYMNIISYLIKNAQKEKYKYEMITIDKAIIYWWGFYYCLGISLFFEGFPWT